MKHVFIVLFAALTALCLLPHGASVRAAGKPIAVITGANSSFSNIEFATLRRVFSGLPTEIGGKRLIPINLANNSPLRVAFDRAVLGLEPGDVGKFWIEKRIRDEGAPPKTVPSPDLALRIAASLPNVIAYASVEGVNASVKVLTVDGKAPTAAGYPVAEK